MTGEELLKMSDDLETCFEGYDYLLGRRENREHFRRFARGQLGTIERKSLEPRRGCRGRSAEDAAMFWVIRKFRDRPQPPPAARVWSRATIPAPAAAAVRRPRRRRPAATKIQRPSGQRSPPSVWTFSNGGFEWM